MGLLNYLGVPILFGCRAVKYKFHVGFLLVNNMQTPPFPPPPLSKRAVFIFLVQKIAQCSETNEKSILRLLVFQIFSFKILRTV